jgi:hypothetical protein
MKILIWTLRILGFIFVIPIIAAFPGFFLFQISEMLEEEQDRKEGKWR